MSIPPFNVPLWVVLTVGSFVALFLYALIGAVTAAVLKGSGSDEDAVILVGVFWPITVVLSLLLFIPIKVYQALTKDAKHEIQQ